MVALAAPQPADACTTFLLERGAARVVGKSYDWHMGQGLVMVNKRGVAKQSLPRQARRPPRALGVAPRERDVQSVRPRAAQRRHERRRTGGRGHVARRQRLREARSAAVAQRAAVDPVSPGHPRLRGRHGGGGATAARVTALRRRPLPGVRQDRGVRGVRISRRQAGGDARGEDADQPQLRRIGRLGGEAARGAAWDGIARALRAHVTPGR